MEIPFEISALSAFSVGPVRENGEMAEGLERSLTHVLGDRTAKVLATQLGVKTVDDLLRHYPRRYVMRGELTDIETLIEGEEATILAEIEKVNVRRIPGRKGGILEVVVTDGRAKLSLTFFNQAWREKDLKVGYQGLFAGKLGSFKGKRQLTHPDYVIIPDGSDVDSAIGEFAGKYLPIYPATGKLPSWKISQCMRLALETLPHEPDYLPGEIQQSFNFPNLVDAFRHIHQPPSLEAAEIARQRLTFDEALLLQLILVQRRAEQRTLFATSRKPRPNGLLARFDASLPFTLTQGQKDVAREIEHDLSQSHPMYRLLQGEVGSGKTVIALRAALAVVDAGGQAAILAPTEVLAQQHFRSFTSLLGELGRAGELASAENATAIALLTGSQNSRVRQENLAKIKSGEAGLVIGTHALLSDGVDFHDLGLIVVDEQHRFGVQQRDLLRTKAKNPPHVLVMTATPIPRTVAMTVFGDLDVSTLRELPSGRAPITTHVISAREKPQFVERAWARIREEAAKGFQAYVVAPRISETESSDNALAIDHYGLTEEAFARAQRILGESDESEEKDRRSANLTSVAELYPLLGRGALKDLRVAVLHGRLPSEEKERTMSEFSRGEIDVLITTTVIEVGVDVPNATMMVIMDADRFGVSQLHQLRGRVGRGRAPGLCLLITQAEQDSPALARLNAVASTLDGFELSRLDLEQRREGDVLGESQSGVRSHLRLLRVLRDEALIEKARAVAQKLLADDPTLSHYSLLKSEVDDLQQRDISSFVDKG